MEKKEEKFTDFISRYTKEVNGQKQIDVIGCLIELYARVTSHTKSIIEISETLADVGQFGIDVIGRIDKLEGKSKIEIVDPHTAKKLIN
jgi:hypothetical protein